MLDRFRKHAYSWTTRIVLGFLAFIFMFWGIGTGFFSQVHPVASVNGTRILPDQLDRQANEMRQTLQSMYGANAANVLKSINLRQEALQQIIEQQLVQDEARHLGIRISNEALQDKIASQRAFHGEDGQFDFRTYEEVLRENNLAPNEYEASLRSSMVADTLRQMVDDGVQVSEDEVRHAYNLRNQKIGLSYIEIPYQDYVSRISPGDQQIAAYYKKNQESFREPERVRIAFIHYEPLTMAAKYTPTDQEIEVYYKRNENSRFTHPDLVHARHILITVPEGATPNEKATAKAKAQDVLEQATKPGADFPKLASKYSEDPSNRLKGGDLGSFGRGQMIKPFEDAVFSMKPGEIRMVETKFGYHVVKLEEFKPAHVDTLQEARPAIIQALRNDAGTKLAREAVDQDVAAALGGLSLQDVAKKRDLDTVETPPFARNESIKGAENDRNLVEAAFKLEPGQVRAIPSGGAPYLVKLIERQPSRIPPLNEITAKVRDVYIRSTAQSEAREQAQKLLEQIKTPDDFGKVATQNKLLIHNDAPFSRTANSVPGIGEFPEVSEAAGLVAKVPGVIQHVMEQDGNSYLFELNSRSDPDDQEWKSAEQSFTDEYLSRRRAEAWTHFLDDLKSRADIVIHTDQIGESPAESSM